MRKQHRNSSISDEASDNKKTDYTSIGPMGFRFINGSTPEYVHFDHQGSAVAATDASGAITWRQTYYPLGEVRADPPENKNNTAYTGHIFDAQPGLSYMQARYYNPRLGRFYSTDPIGYEDQMNLYAYVHNDPVNRIDPNGEADIFIGGANDQRSGIVRGFAARFAAQNPNRTVAYFQHGQANDAIAYAKLSPANEPLNIIGHSYGGSAAVAVAQGSFRQVDNLIGVDAVSKISGSPNVKNLPNVANVTSVDATGKQGGISNGNFIAGLGRALGGGQPDIFNSADTNISVNAPHADFGSLFEGNSSGGPSAGDIVRNSTASSSNASFGFTQGYDSSTEYTTCYGDDC